MSEWNEVNEIDMHNLDLTFKQHDRLMSVCALKVANLDVWDTKILKLKLFQYFMFININSAYLYILCL